MANFRWIAAHRRQAIRRILYRLQDRVALSASESRAMVLVLSFALCGMVVQHVRIYLLPDPVRMQDLRSDIPLVGPINTDAETGDSARTKPANSERMSSSKVASRLRPANEIMLSSDSLRLPSTIGAEREGAERLNSADSVGQWLADKSSMDLGWRIDLNQATLSELEALPGVGPAIARRIDEYRREVGRFISVEELTAVRGIGPKKLEQIRQFAHISWDSVK